MEKIVYYIECKCIKNCSYPNVDFHIGDIVYYNPKAASNEMYLGYIYKENKSLSYEELLPYVRRYQPYTTYLPFTRQKKNAKKWQVKRYPDWTAHLINGVGEFETTVKEIKVTYTEEEI